MSDHPQSRQLTEPRADDAHGDDISGLGADGVRRLVHELRTHQIELNAQNEELRAAQAELSESHDRYSDLYENAPVGYVTVDAEGRIAELNSTLACLLNRSKTGLVNRPFHELVHPDDQDALYLLRRTLQEGRSGQPCELRLCVGGREIDYVWTRVDCRPLQSPCGSAGWFRAAVSDVSAAKEAEKVQQESDARWRSLTESSTDHIFLIDPDLRILFANRSVGGIVRESLPGTSILDYMQAESVSALADCYASCRRAVAPKSVDVEAELEPGAVRLFEVTIGPVVQEGKTVAFTTNARDITERRRAALERRASEAQLQHSQKMEAIGRLAGGVAHDMNNILGGVMGYASLLQVELDDASPRAKYVTMILAACTRARELTTNLLGFARRGQYQNKAVSIPETVYGVENLLRHSMPKTIDLVVKLDADLDRVSGDPGQLSQALLNLCINSVDSMQPAGTLTISASNVTLEEAGRQAQSGLAAGRYVRVVVADNGTGMSADTAGQAFEPFFTTKEKGKGTGLGLSMVYGTIQNHGGEVTMDSELGRGTTVNVLLPSAVHGEPTEQTTESAAVESDTGTILLVDDEALVRSSAKELLEQVGYEVWTADNGAKALEIYERRGGEIRLVILDVMMPVMDGPETLRRLMQLDPAARVMITSGFSEQEPAKALQDAGARGFLQKPFDRNELCQAVRTALAVASEERRRPTSGPAPER